MLLTVLLLIVHVLVCIMLILVVLLQTGKRADLAGAFGGGGSQTAFGARGAASVLSKATTVAAAVFMLTSLALAYRMGQTSESSVLGDEAPAPTETMPLPGLPGDATGETGGLPAIPGAPPADAGDAPSEDGGEATPEEPAP